MVGPQVFQLCISMRNTIEIHKRSGQSPGSIDRNCSPNRVRVEPSFIRAKLCSIALEQMSVEVQTDEKA